MEAASLFSRQKIDVLVLSPSEEILFRIAQVTERLKLAVHRLPDVEAFVQNSDQLGAPNVIIVDFSMAEDQLTFLEKVRRIKKFAVAVYLVTLILDPSDFEFIKKLKDAGVDHVQVAADVLSSMRLDFLLMNQFLLKYYPIDLRDLFPGTEITFTAFHYMVLNNKYLPVIFERFILSDKKFKRLEKVDQLYIQNQSTGAYQKYIESYYDSVNTGLQKRIKAAFLQVMSTYTEIRILMMNGEGPEDAQKLRDLLSFCEKSHHRLVDYIKSSAEPFYNYVQLYQAQGASSFDRNLFIAGLAAFLAEMSGVAKPGIIFKCSLIAYSGLMYSDYITYLKWHDQHEKEWSLQDTEQFSETLKISVELGRLNLADFNGTMSQAVSHIFERFDGKGLPHKVAGDRIPVETAVIQIADGWLRKISKARMTDAHEAYESFKNYLEFEKKSGKISPKVIEKIQQVGFLKS